MSANTTAYYDATAKGYDALHGGEADPEHIRALEYGWPLIGPVRSALDVGCGSGRSLRWLHDRDATLELAGVDPSSGLLKLASQFLPHVTLHQAGGEKLPFPDNSHDLVLATGIMHHVDSPSAVISEMFRVARKAVIISDHNNFAFGGSVARRLRLGLYSCGLLPAFQFIKQGFKRQGYSEDDGWWYPYSLFEDYELIAQRSSAVYIIPTRRPSAGGNIIFSQSHFAIAAII